MPVTRPVSPPFSTRVKLLEALFLWCVHPGRRSWCSRRRVMSVNHIATYMCMHMWAVIGWSSKDVAGGHARAPRALSQSRQARDPRRCAFLMRQHFTHILHSRVRVSLSCFLSRRRLSVYSWRPLRRFTIPLKPQRPRLAAPAQPRCCRTSWLSPGRCAQHRSAGRRLRCA